MSLAVPRVLALSPTGLTHPGLVVAACRAGALGLLDLELGGDLAAVSATIDRLKRLLGHRPFGLRVAAEDVASLATILPASGLGTLVVCEPQGEPWHNVLARARGLAHSVLAEVTSRGAARDAIRAEADGLVVAGHEAAGAGGEESSFILLQGVLAEELGPVWVRGGIGPRAAAGCIAAGARGVVLDGALLLARESPIPETTRAQIGSWDGSESIVLGRSTGRPYRLFGLPGLPALQRLRDSEGQGGLTWASALRAEVGWDPARAWPVGQDAALAADLAKRHTTVGGIVQAVERAMDEQVQLATEAHPLAEGSPLALSHATRFPIVQGPMTRVSDSVAFAEAVAEGGALPFLALALLRGDEVRSLLANAGHRLGGRPWGVGILGFVPPELRHEQVAALRETKPPFALIAGGRPDQARELEAEGIATYLHAPSPGLLRQYLRQGARRFVLEGRECGGHVGPRSSLVLWEQAVGIIEEAIGSGAAIDPTEIHLLFAGGIHDGRSAALVSALAAPLAARGVCIGVLVGTAYLFTEEAVSTGAIVPGFQDEAIRCERTVLLETGPGHEVRVCPTPFAESFERERLRLLAEGRAADEVRQGLEDLNVGRLRVASKGLERTNGSASSLAPIPADRQRERGLYMVGQVAALRDRVGTIAELHHEISEGSVAHVEKAARSVLVGPDRERKATPSDIAIVGMSALFPGATSAEHYWQNTLRGHDAITEIPPDRWDWRLYYDPDPKTPDKITSKWGGFLPEIPFDPLRYGMPPSSLTSIEPMHLLTLEAVRAALDDAGYRDRPFPKERTAVVLGAGGGAAQLAMGYAFRSYLPLLDTVIPEAGREALNEAGKRLPEWTEDSFPGILLNVAAGRVANRFDLGGANYTVDAACGSSLAAASLAVRELESGAADMVILGGADTVQNPFTYLAFSKTHAFSPRGRCRPFDASADGIVISEGVAVLVLKRLADAERDGDRIYAVIKGLGASSDGRARGLTAPHVEGQVRALRRAYEKSGVGPDSVGYVEAHGTGTSAGDLAEVEALAQVFGQAGAAPGSCALGSVKSLIGHTKCAAGLAGLINASLALYHRVLPPTIGVDAPNPRFGLETSPFHVNTAARPWLHADDARPRRAGVSAFGFGGTNFHAVLEAYEGDPGDRPSPLPEWPAELLVWRSADRDSLLSSLDELSKALQGGARPRLRDLARSLAETSAAHSAPSGPVLAIVATSLDDLIAKLTRARQEIANGRARWDDPAGIAYAETPAFADGRVAFLFPGQGSQYPNMLRELALAFPEVREAFEQFDAALRSGGREPVGSRVFPPPALRGEEREAQRLALRAPDVAQPAVGAACVGLLRLLCAMGLEPDFVAGHSYGELVALHAAGCLTAEALAALSNERGRLMLAAAGQTRGAMAALTTGPAQATALLEGIADVWPVNWNGPSQTVISGTVEAIEQVVGRAGAMGIRAQILPVPCAFHSPFVAGAAGQLAEAATRAGLATPAISVFSNTTATRYPEAPEAIAAQLGEHLARPVRFAEMLEALHDAGARVFVEVGPGGIVSALTGSILAGRPHLAAACDQSGQPGLAGFLRSLARLVVAGLPIRLQRLTAGRAARVLDLNRPETWNSDEPLTSSTWLVNGARARPASGPAPIPFGQGPALPPGPRSLPQTTGEGSPPRASMREPMTSSPTGAGADRVMDAFQKTMQTFLDVQQRTMLAYLNAQARPQSPLPGLPSEPTPQHAQSIPIVDPAGRIDRPELPDKAIQPVGHDAIGDRLLQIVRERTGYPTEMLRLDLDLEADLGIDSIKRIEILNSLREALPQLAIGAETAVMDRLSRARTLGEIVDQIERAAGRDGSEPRPEADEAARLIPTNGHTLVASESSNGNESGRLSHAPAARAIGRFLLEPVEAPLPSARAGLAPGGLVVVTDDGRGVGRAVAADLKALGHPTILVRHGLAGNGHEGVNLMSPASVSALIERVRARGPLAGIVHALPLRDEPPAELDAEAWSARMGVELRGLFLLAKAAAEDLLAASKRGGACLIAASALGGSYGSAGGWTAGSFPGQGGIAGLLKTLSAEWPSVRTRAVDLDPTAEPEVLGAHLVHEFLAADPRPEVGYQDGRRIVIRHHEASLNQAQPAAIELKPGEPIVMTGGARGITAAVAAELARAWRPTLLLVGTSPAPDEEEDAEAAAAGSPAELKSLLLARLRREGRPSGPADVERRYQALRRRREIQANLRALHATGARVEYRQVDVRDAEALARVLDDWARRHGPPVGLIHGAGVIQDKLLCDKTPESFDRVLDTKLMGAVNLVRHVQADQLRFATFFSSVAGRFGNRGQGDYAAANDALNKLALWLDRRWPCRVLSVNWGPWSGVGMVSDLEAHLGRRGLGLIPPDVGPRLLLEELRFGRKGDVEVILAGELAPLLTSQLPVERSKATRVHAGSA